MENVFVEWMDLKTTESKGKSEKKEMGRMKLWMEEIKILGTSRSINTMFPGAALLPNGELVMLMVAGSGFESSDQFLIQARSRDLGRSWEIEDDAASDLTFPGLQPFSPCAKPTLCPDGTLIAAGYGFHRDRPEMGLSDYAEKFGKFPAADNFIISSSDNGKTWSCPRIMKHGYDGLELSGPLLAMEDGELLLFAAPFVLHASVQRGLTFSSRDGGLTWQQRSDFFESESVAPWEVRSIQLPEGRIMLVFWAFDLAGSKHLNNHIVYSDDRGITWSRPIDTSLRGQASNFLMHGNRLGILQARREGNAPGIYLSDIKLEHDTVSVTDEACLFDAAGMTTRGTQIEKQFAALKFGQPSAVHLPDGAYLLIFWSMDSRGIYAVKTRRFTINKDQ